MVNRIQAVPRASLQGLLLVAAPHWQHEFFGQSVCLVVHHSSDRAIGVFLNHSLGKTPQALWHHLAGEQPVSRSINFGGPHSGPVVALHDRRELAEFTSAEGVYLAAQIDHLRQLVTSPKDESAVKIIVGQADWQAGQLDAQFANGQWLPLPVSPSIVFADESEMWGRAMRQIGNHFVASIAGCSGQPRDLLAN